MHNTDKCGNTDVIFLRFYADLLSYAFAQCGKGVTFVKIKYKKYMTEYLQRTLKQCQQDMADYKVCGETLMGQLFAYIRTSNIQISDFILHRGFLYVEAYKKVEVINDNTHTDSEKEKRIKQLESEVKALEEILKHDLEYRNLLTL